MTKAIAICGSPRKGGNTEQLMQHALDVLAKSGIETELVQLAGKTIHGCRACRACGVNKDEQCTLDDDLNPILKKMIVADIILVGSPVYFGSATPELMAFLDRIGCVVRANGHLFARKLGGPIVVARRAGQNFTYAQLLYWYMISGMIVPGSTYWNVGFGLQPGDIQDDAEAKDTVTGFAENLAWLAEKTVG